MASALQRGIASTPEKSMGQRDSRWPIVPCMRQFYVYLLASHSRRLYVGVTNDLFRRVAQHRQGMGKFTSKYHITRLVYFETTTNVMSAIAREKQLKGWIRRKKVELIESENPMWEDLAAGWFR